MTDDARSSTNADCEDEPPAADDGDETTTADGEDGTATAGDGQLANTPGQGVTPEAQAITPGAPGEFGLVQAWYGDGKGKTTAALGMGFRAAGHGYRVHLLQFMKGGAASVEAVRGEYNAIAAVPGFSYETTGEFGWHGFLDGTEDDEHAARAAAALDRAEAVVAGARGADLATPFDPDSDPESGVHMLILDEVLYAANRGLVDADAVAELVAEKPQDLEVVLTGGHEEPDWLPDRADLVTNVRKVAHPFDEGQRARKGTEY